MGGALRYARAKDKSDKSLDAFKFYINALYVAITRAVENLVLVEQTPSHRLLPLLGLTPTGTGAHLAAQQSSTAEWKAEARKLDLQGKTEQAEAIRTTILAIQAVPWPVLTPATLATLTQEACDPAHYNRQAKQRLFEYAVLYQVPALLARLAACKFTRATHAETELPAVERKYHQDYTGKSLPELDRKIGLYGVDFRNPLNQTPLMIAARLGLLPLIRTLLRDGATPTLVDNWGRTPLQIALRYAFRDARYARTAIGEVYPALAPSSLKVRIDDRLTKLDNHRPEFFLVNAMLAVAQDILRVKIRYALPAFQTADFVEALAQFPDHVIPPWRKRRRYLTAVLARHERSRQDPDTRRLFLRVARGYYILNPRMEVEGPEGWVNVYDLLQIQHLEQETGDPRLQQFVQFVRHWQQAAPPPEGPSPSPASARGSHPEGPAEEDRAAVVPISADTFHRIQASLRQLSGDAEVPQDVRPRARERE